MICLAEMLSFLGSEEFRDSYWPTKHIACDGASAHKSIRNEVCDIIDLRNLRPLDLPCVRRLSPSESMYKTSVVRSCEYDNTEFDTTWSVAGAQQYSLTIDQILTALSDLLCLPKERMTATIFVSPRVEGLPWHFDPAETIVIQIEGKKKWELSANTQILFPDKNGFAKQVILNAAENVYRDGSQEGLEAPQTIDFTWVAEPGGACFIPRGMWHRTQAHIPSVSVSISLDTPTHMDLLLNALRELLSSAYLWREPVSPGSAQNRIGPALDKIASALGIERM